ncbi:MAG: nucleoside deaminase [Rhodomicrobium sp.]
MDTKIFMGRVIDLSREAIVTGKGGPFGAVVVRNGKIVAEAHNEVLSTKDPTAHAETLAIRRASAKLNTFDLSDCDLYTNGAPCCMCMSAALWARIRTLYYILGMEESAAIGLGDDHLYEELARPLDQRRIVPMIQDPALAEEANAIYRMWHELPGRLDF